MANELLEFPGGVLGLAFNLDEDEIGCIILGESAHIEEGDPVKQTGRILSIPVGDGFLGRVVDALGRPIDGKGADRRRASDANLEVQAPNVVDAPAGEGTAVHGHHRDRRDDGDRARSAPADHRRPPDRQDRRRDRRDHRPEASYWGTDAGRCKCIYVAIGQKASTVAEVVETLRENGALEYTMVVNAVGLRPRAVPVRRALRGRGARRALDVQGRARR